MTSGHLSGDVKEAENMPVYGSEEESGTECLIWEYLAVMTV